MTTRYIHGLHDPGGEELMATRPGWVVLTEDAVKTHGRDYRRWSDSGFGVVVRLNWGYEPEGTIPLPGRYDQFAAACAEFVTASRGCSRWLIGNEPNYKVERPWGQLISPEMYADCFRRCAVAIISSAGSGHELIPAAVAPWNVDSGDWLDYFREMLIGCQDYADGIALHVYTHGASPELITSEAMMQHPYEHRRYNFRAYRDFLDAVPAALRGLPAYITETDQIDPWLDQNNGWVQAAYHEVDEWNKRSGGQKIHCLALYRWSRDDQWSIQDKPKVQEAFRQAVNLGYRVPEASPVQPAAPHTMFLPFIPGGNLTVPETTLPSRTVDPRLITRGVTIADANVEAGALFWRLIEAQWYSEAEAGGRRHIYVEAVDETGAFVPGLAFAVTWPDGEAMMQTSDRAGFGAGNYPMSPSRNEFSVRMAGDQPSDQVHGIGMGEDTPSGFNPGAHTSTRLRFGLARMPARSVVTPSPEPPAATPVSAALIDPRVAAAVMEVEAGRDGFGADGRLKIRFEAHIFRSKLGNDELWSRYFRVGTPAWIGQQWRAAADAAWQDIHTGRQADEYAALEFAMRLDVEAAYQSVSMGAGQLMGFNAQRVGYPSAHAMFDAFDDSVADQMLAFANFVLSDPALHQAINARNWERVGELYNGSASAGGLYRAAYVRLWGGE